MKTRKTYSKEFKLDAVSLVTGQDFKVAEESRCLGISAKMLGCRLKECDALTMALWQLKPKAGLIHHSDRGSQYASRQFSQLLTRHKVTYSMSRKSDCWDSAIIESFFGTLKQEREQWHHYQSRHAAQQDILQYITMPYNSQSIHS